MSRRARKPRSVDALPPGSVRRGGRDLPDANSRRQGAFERARKAERRRRRLKIAGISAASLLTLVAVVVGVTFLQIRAGLMSGLAADPRIREVLDPTGGLSKEPFYLLILGSDRREDEVIGRSDTIILARIDMQENTVSMLSIPRDTRVDIPGHGTNKINAASAFGGTSLMIETVQGFTGLPVNHYMSVDFRGFKEMVDALGGVWIDVPMAIDDRQAASEYPEARVIEAGRQKLDGKHALTFVRARYSLPRQDLDRIENQQLFIRAMIAEARGERNPLRLKALGEAAADSLDTDMEVGQLVAVGRKLSDSLDMLDMAVMPGEPQRIGGVSYVVADSDELAVLIERLREGLPMNLDDEEPGPGIDRSAVSVTVHNGFGIAGAAGAAAARLEARGYGVGDVGNANQFVYDETLVVFRDGGADAAALIAEDLGKGRPVASRGMYAFSTDILVVIGKDWAER